MHNRFAYAPVDRHAAAVKAAATRARRDAEAADKTKTYAPGDILSGSWGYDQTNVEFFQVITATAKSVTIRELAQHAIDREHVIPLANTFGAAPAEKRMVGRYGYIKLHESCSLSPWSGSPKYQTAFGGGH